MELLTSVGLGNLADVCLFIWKIDGVTPLNKRPPFSVYLIENG